VTGPAGARVGDPLPRVVLLDDDPAICRLVELILEEEALALTTCASVAQARAALAQAPTRLLLTDLMMSGETGLDLLEQWQADPGLPRPARVVVFSAGLDAPTRSRLARLGVWRLLAKPVAVSELLGVVRKALDSGDDPPAEGDPAAPAVAQASPTPSGAGEGARAHAIAGQFAGQAALYDAFRSSCLALFRDDLSQGDAALSAGDAATLRRLGHSLKGVLHGLGETAAGDAAERLDLAAQQALAGTLPELASLAAPWHALRGLLQALVDGQDGAAGPRAD
jgi:CheY-like chemotaxis protein